MHPVSNPSDYIDAGGWFPGATAAIRHYEDSMIEYPSGCILVLKEVVDRHLLVWGKNYCIETSEFRVTKKLQKGNDELKDYFILYSTNTDKHPDGRLKHEPIEVLKKEVARLFLVLGYVVKEFSNGPVYIQNNAQIY